MVVKKRRAKPLLIIFISIIVLLVVGVISTITAWNILTGPVDKNNKDKIEVVIPNGTTPYESGKLLKDKGLIKNELVFKIYVKLNSVNHIKASTYHMNKSMDLKQMIKMLQEGNSYNPDEIKITFKEGEWITDYAKEIAKRTENTYDDVISKINDKEYLQTLITKYWFLTDSILQEGIYYPLEGYLAPNTYYFANSKVSVEKIVEKMLDQTEKELKEYKSKIETNPHHYITMASLAELEGTNTNNRKDIVGVFNNRLKIGMNLGSDVTTYYGLQHPMNSDLTSEQFNTPNAYNTRATALAGKMPIGPICNPSKSSLEASINPNNNDYLFFVADKHGNIYFTKTNAEHVAKVNEIKQKGDWIW